MNEEILALSVVSGIGIKLKEIFPDTTWYREAIVNLVYPHFFVFQLTQSATEDRANYWFIDYLITIRYRVANDVSTVTNLQEQLDTVGLRLHANLDEINWFREPVRIKNPRYEKIDGVLHFFCNVRIQATKPKEEVVKQMKLQIIQGLKIGDDD